MQVNSKKEPNPWEINRCLLPLTGPPWWPDGLYGRQHGNAKVGLNTRRSRPAFPVF